MFELLHSMAWIRCRSRRTWLAACCLPAVVVLWGACSSPQFDSAPAPSRLEVADVSGPEGGRTLRFTVTRTQAGGAVGSVAYATEPGTAMPGLDYQPATGTLSYGDGPSDERSIEVAVVDDAVDEADETFTLRLSDRQGTPLATATATIVDDDRRGVRVSPTELTLDDQRSARYLVVLTSEPTAAVSVHAQVLDANYAVIPERLTFTTVDWATAQRVTVTASERAPSDGSEVIRHLVSGGDYDGEPAAAVTVGNLTQPAPTPVPPTPSAPTLRSLQVDGAIDTMYPEFAPGVKHYAVRCGNPSTLDVTAETARGGVRMTLLRADPTQNHVSLSRSLHAVAIDAHENHDVAIELSDSHGTSTYVVHCIPADFPQVGIPTRTGSASGGLLFATPGGEFMTILDYNGVPRFYRASDVVLFQPHADGPLVDGKQVHYSVMRTFDSPAVLLLDKEFNQIREVVPVAPLTQFNRHGFLTTENGNLLFTSYEKTSRDISDPDPIWNPYRGTHDFEDSLIQEVSLAGDAVFTWNSWDFLKLLPDCERDGFLGDYAHINSLQLLDEGDILASLPGCSQVVRIDRSSGSWALDWKLGGTTPTRNPDTEYKEIVGDSVGHNEFCGQHQATLNKRNGREVVLMYDNGIDCVGTRKGETPFTRVVEYDITSRSQASVLNQYKLPKFTRFEGGVNMLDNGNWLIAWGIRSSDTQSMTVSEVSPGGSAPDSATVHFEMQLYEGTSVLTSYRVYHAPEADVDIPFNLP